MCRRGWDRREEEERERGGGEEEMEGTDGMGLYVYDIK